GLTGVAHITSARRTGATASSLGLRSGARISTPCATPSRTDEGAGVAIPTIQLLIGHSRKQTMGATATYTQGERVSLRKVIGKLRYFPRVMQLLARAPYPRAPVRAHGRARRYVAAMAGRVQINGQDGPNVRSTRHHLSGYR